MKYINEMELKFISHSVNESFARSAVASFCVQLNPSLDEITDIKTAVSEAVTNCVVHAYPDKKGEIRVFVGLSNYEVVIRVSDEGVGIDDFQKAREPFFTTRPTEERAGMGFTVMESFMDSVELHKNGERGVVVEMKKAISPKNAIKKGIENG